MRGSAQSSPAGALPILVVLLLASPFGIWAGLIVTPVLEMLRVDMDVTGAAVGLVITAHGVTFAASSPVIGRIVDRYGFRGALSLGLVVYGLAGGVGILITSFPLLIISWAILGIGAAAIFSGSTVALLTLYQGAMRDRAMGWRHSMIALGGVIWPLLAGALGGINWRAAFAIYLVGIPLGVATLLLAPPHRRPTPRRLHDTGGARDLLRRHPTLLAWYGLMIAGGLTLYTLAVYLPQRLAQLGVEHPAVVALFTVVVPLVSSIVGVFYTRISKRLTYAVMLRAAAGCWTASFLILATATSPALLLPATALFGLGNGITLPVLTVLIEPPRGVWRLH